MGKLFVNIAVALLFMGCVSNTIIIDNDENQVITSPNLIEQVQNNSQTQNMDHTTCPSEDACPTHKEANNSEHILGIEDEIIQQTDPDQALEDPEQEIYALEANSVAETELDDYATEQQYAESAQSYADKVIYLTFDDGPSSNTPKVLDILREENVKATFFVTGHHKNFVHLIKREFEEGHTIGAHTFSHKYEIYTSQETYFNDLERLQKVIEKYTGSRTNLIRLPGGSSNTIHLRYSNDPNFMNNLCKELRHRGYQYIDWNLSAKDASSGYIHTSTIVEKACRGNKKSICLLMHDSFGKETTVEALPTIIQHYKQEGYRFGTLDVSSSGYHHNNYTPKR